MHIVRAFPILSCLFLLLSCASGKATEGANSDGWVNGADSDSGTAEESHSEPSAEWCEGSTRSLYDPQDGSILGAWPDDFYTIKDASTPTGLRVDLREDNAPWIGSVPGQFGANVPELNDLDGFGTSAGIFFRASKAFADLPSGYPESVENDALQLWELNDDGAVRVPFEIRMTDDDSTLIMWPMRALKPKTQHAAVMTQAALAADGQCIAPSDVTKALLTGAEVSPALSDLSERLQEMLEMTGLDPRFLSVATVFTTQSIVDEALVVLNDIQSHKYSWVQAANCNDKPQVRICTAKFKGRDYRKNKIFAGGEPQKEYSYPVSIWLPTEGQGPYPTILFGHGIGGSKSQAGMIAEFAASIGLATVAMDAVHHGNHPAGASGNPQLDMANFFGVNILSLSINGRALRDNFRQSAWDKVQLLQVLLDQPDVDGDGKDDIDTEHITYWGVSLGGIMGVELMALSDRIGAAILDVCGGRITDIITQSDQFGAFISLLAPADATPGDVDRFFAMAQILVERGDPANFARYVLNDRITGSRIPQLLMHVAKDDPTIPNVASWHMARSLGLPHLQPVVDSVDMLEPIVPLPVSGNMSDGAATAGLFQMDRVTPTKGGKPQAAGHSSTPASLEAITQTVHFMQSWIKDGVATVIDPYEQLSTPPL